MDDIMNDVDEDKDLGICNVDCSGKQTGRNELCTATATHTILFCYESSNISYRTHVRFGAFLTIESI